MLDLHKIDSRYGQLLLIILLFVDIVMESRDKGIMIYQSLSFIPYHVLSIRLLMTFISL